MKLAERAPLQIPSGQGNREDTVSRGLRRTNPQPCGKKLKK